MLTGCTSDREFQERIIHYMAQNRAEIINMDLPISYKNLTIYKAKSKSGIIYISAKEERYINSDNQDIINQICRDKETRRILKYGVKYELNIIGKSSMIIDDDKCASL
ncbi:type II secretion system pilot lipoprotein GspS-beta [Vibrio jasicida]